MAPSCEYPEIFLSPHGNRHGSGATNGKLEPLFHELIGFTVPEPYARHLGHSIHSGTILQRGVCELRVSFGVKGSIAGFRLDCQLTKQLSATAIIVYGLLQHYILHCSVIYNYF